MAFKYLARREIVASTGRHVVVATLLWLSLAESAWAYLDPGTGWMIVQGFVAAIAAAGVAVGSYWSRIRGWFSSRRTPPGTATPERSEPEQN